MLMLATVTGIGLAAYRAWQVRLDPEVIYSLAFAMFIAGIIGAGCSLSGNTGTSIFHPSHGQLAGHAQGNRKYSEGRFGRVWIGAVRCSSGNLVLPQSRAVAFGDRRYHRAEHGRWIGGWSDWLLS